jgi:hypothetical protein
MADAIGRGINCGNFGNVTSKQFNTSGNFTVSAGTAINTGASVDHLTPSGSAGFGEDTEARN